MKLSIVTPAFNEAANLPGLYGRLAATLRDLGMDWEWIVVDDHSRDETFTVVTQLATSDSHVRGVRLARNSGSHTAIRCGLHLASGDAAIIVAGDLQDPPEVLPALVDRWRVGAQVVWAVRRSRPGEPAHKGFAAIYYWIMRNPVGLREIPANGADFCLVDRAVLDAFRQLPERNANVLALIAWLGFRQESVEYDKQPRMAGRSGWSTAAKIRIAVDSITSFSHFPIRACALSGALLMALGIVLFVSAVLLLPRFGALLLLVLATVVGLTGLQLFALGVIGEYVWRALDESRRRPAYAVEAVTPSHDAAGQSRQGLFAGLPGA